MEQPEIRTTFICGHRNPDVDSIMSACALADLKKQCGEKNVSAICPGMMPERAAWLLSHFGVTPPPQRNDVFLRVSDIMRTDRPSIPEDDSLFAAVQTMRDGHAREMTVTAPDGRYTGMLSSFSLLSRLLNVGSDEGASFTGREVYSSTAMIADVLNAEVLAGTPEQKPCPFDVFVAAMSPDFFEKHLDARRRNELAIIVGDRPEIHLRVIQHSAKLLIITGNCPVETAVTELASIKNVTVLRTALDSATVIRRLRFSSPVKSLIVKRKASMLAPDDMVRDVKAQIMSAKEDVFPVCDGDLKLLGTVAKSDVISQPPYRMILVDHNEMMQSIPGLEDIPVVEIVDHHRMAMRATPEPIKVTADVVGSTCTLVSMMYRAAGLRPKKSIAGILLAGIITDTLVYQSPTTTPLDRRTGEWLEAICGEKGSDLMNELMKINSPLAAQTSSEVLSSDCKSYSENGYSFTLSQAEENNLALLSGRREGLLAEMEKNIAEGGLDFTALLVTDPVRGNSELLYAGNKAVMRALPYKRLSENHYFLPGVLSRKKQLLPQILSVTGALRKS